MELPIPQSQVELRSKSYRKSPNENILVMETTVRTSSGYILQDLVLVKPMVDTSGIVNGSLYPVREHYDEALGIYYSEFEIVESPDTDIPKYYSLTGAFRSLEVSEDIDFIVTNYLSQPEQPPRIINQKQYVEDGKFFVVYNVRRKNGKIPKAAYLPNQASVSIGLKTGELISQSYNQFTGELVGTYLADVNGRVLELHFETEVYLGDTVPSTQVRFFGVEEVIRLFDIKVLARTLKKNIMSVVLGVKWKDTGKIPTDFALESPFAVGTNVPTGTVDPKSTSYDPVNGVYLFDIKVSTVAEGRLDYNFITKAHGERYPDVTANIHLSYDHQKVYTSKLLSVLLSEGKLSAEWEITSIENPDYRLENFGVAPLELGIGLKGKPMPTVTWQKGNKSFITTWDVNTDNGQEQKYNFRGHFLANNKKIPWVLQTTAVPIAMSKGKVGRLDAKTVGFTFTLLSDKKIVDVVATQLVVLTNGIPTSKKITQDRNKDPAVVSGSFLLDEQVDDSVEITLVGNVLVLGENARYIPVNISGKDYIPFPEPTSGISAEMISHTVSDGVEKVSFNIRFDNKINYPVNGVLVDGKVKLNGAEITPERFSYKDGVATIWNKVTTTGLRQEFKLEGTLTFSGYSREVTCDFADSLVIGSDSFPAILGNPYITSNDDKLSFSFVTTLRDGKLPKSVKLVNIVESCNVVDDGLLQATFVYTDDSGNTMFAFRREVSVDKKLQHSVTLRILVSDGAEEESQLVRFTRTEDYPLVISTQYVGYTYKDSVLTLKHRLVSNKPLPDKVTLQGTPELTGCSDFDKLKYDNKDGLLTYSVQMPYLGGVQDFGVELDITFDGATEPVLVSTGINKYSPAGTATHKAHFFNEDGSLTCVWQFRDPMGDIPKLIRIEDFWKYNINIRARAVNLNYNPITGLGSVTINPSPDSDEHSQFYAETTFKFPSPDVNIYSLRIDINRPK